MDNDNGKTMLVVIALIIGLIAGGGTGYALGMNAEDKKGEDSTSMKKDSSKSSTTGVDGVTVGGAKMVRSLDIVDNAVNASNVTTLVSLVKLADLVETLKGPGPFTVFAPNNGAFAKLPAATVADLQKPENKATLAGILTYHVVSGTYTGADLRVMANKGEKLTSVEGNMLMPVLEGGMLKIKDEAGDSVDIETADIISSNGVTHVIDSVLMSTK